VKEEITLSNRTVSILKTTIKQFNNQQSKNLIIEKESAYNFFAVFTGYQFPTKHLVHGKSQCLVQTARLVSGL